MPDHLGNMRTHTDRCTLRAVALADGPSYSNIFRDIYGGRLVALQCYQRPDRGKLNIQ